MKTRIIRTPLALLAASLFAGCSIQGFEDDLNRAPPNDGAGASGGALGSAPNGSGGNPLERPRGDGGRDAAPGNAGAGSSSSTPAGTAPSPAGEGGAAPMGGTGSASGRGGAPGAASGGAVTSGGSGALGGADGGAAQAGANGGALRPPAGASGLGGDSSAGAPGMIPVPPDAWFSEYVEGSSYNKALEISVRSDGSLDGCTVEIYQNDSKTPRRITLRGPISAAEPRVLCDTKFAEPSRCHALQSLPFNGNDVVALRCGDELLDVIGKLGDSDLDYWGSGELKTMDMTLRRRCDITSGDPDATDPFDPATEWIAAGLDAFDDLGVHCPAEL